MFPIKACGFNAHAPQGQLSGLERQLERMAEIGAEIVELNAASLDCVAAGRLVDERVKAVSDLLNRYEMMRSLHLPIPINLMDRGHIKLHERAARVGLELAAALGAGICVVHPGRVAPAVWLNEQESLLAFERDRLYDLGNRAAALGVRIAYENISPNPKVMAGLETSYALDPRLLAQQLMTLDHPAITGCLDISHAQQGAGLWDFDTIEACEAMAPVTGHIHFSDSTGLPMHIDLDGRPEHLHWFGVGDMHSPPGWGLVDFAKLATRFRPLPDTLCVIELHANLRGHSDQQTIIAAKAFASQINEETAHV